MPLEQGGFQQDTGEGWQFVLQEVSDSLLGPDVIMQRFIDMSLNVVSYDFLDVSNLDPLSLPIVHHNSHVKQTMTH